MWGECMFVDEDKEEPKALGWVCILTKAVVDSDPFLLAKTINKVMGIQDLLEEEEHIPVKIDVMKRHVVVVECVEKTVLELIVNHFDFEMMKHSDMETVQKE
ncbi:hypothetical protein L1987_58055 [Smallanthus sonchifolius]|uniref:Uncharacterized protein n=1 Tax=Smallanthus sonchifolius TaxID=185202 RepID=A0ACB9DFB1_9ASTR|nr:hypothetical protein L1987_58055 [Smallanthus sonchifolius]